MRWVACELCGGLCGELPVSYGELPVSCAAAVPAAAGQGRTPRSPGHVLSRWLPPRRPTIAAFLLLSASPVAAAAVEARW